MKTIATLEDFFKNGDDGVCCCFIIETTGDMLDCLLDLDDFCKIRDKGDKVSVTTLKKMIKKMENQNN